METAAIIVLMGISLYFVIKDIDEKRNYIKNIDEKDSIILDLTKKLRKQRITLEKLTKEKEDSSKVVDN